MELGICVKDVADTLSRREKASECDKAWEWEKTSEWAGLTIRMRSAGELVRMMSVLGAQRSVRMPGKSTGTASAS